jgi:Na+/melibiose symporter-like transporter
MARLQTALAVFRLAARNRQLVRVGLSFAAFCAVQTGIWLALLVYAYRAGGAGAASAIALIQLLPGVVLSPLLASLADRWPPTRVLAGGYLALAASAGVLAVVLALDGPTALVFALAPIVNLALCVPRPAQATALPGVVESPEELAAANGAQGWIESISMIGAPLLVAVLLGLDGPALATAAMALLALGAAVCVLPVKGPDVFAREPGADAGVGAAVAASVRVVASNRPVLLLLLIMAAQYAIVGALDLLFVVLAINVLGMGQAGAGYLTAAFGAGGLAAAVVTAGLIGGRRLAPALIGGAALASLALMALAALPPVAGAFLLVAAAGLGRTVLDVSGRTLLQRTSPPAVLAGVFGILESLLNAGLALGSVLVPLLIWLGGVQVALVGTAGLLVALLAITGRQLWIVDSQADVPLTEIYLLRSIPLFAALPAPAVETLARSLERMSVPGGSVLIRQGDPGDRYYAIGRGELTVFRDGRELARLSRGDGVGEIALLRDTPRTATVVAGADAEVYALDRELFLLAVTGHAHAARSANAVVDERLADLERRSSAAHPG